MMVAEVDGRGASSGNLSAGPALAVQGLSCWYGSQQVVFGVSLEIPEGGGVALVGRNGVGKTTFLRGLANAFGVRTTGLVRLDGVDVSDWRPEKIARAGVGFVPHDRRIFPLTVRENLQLGARGQRGWTSRADDVLESFPLLKDRLRQRGDTLSGGEQQALAIARALMARPRYLLLDEPAEGLAPALVDQLKAALLNLRRDTSMGLLLVDRNTSLISDLCNDVYGMSKGQIVHHASSKEFGEREDLQVLFLAPTADDSLSNVSGDGRQ